MTYPGSNQAPTDPQDGPTGSDDYAEVNPIPGQPPGTNDPTFIFSLPHGSAPSQAGANGAPQLSEPQPETSNTNVAINIPGTTTSSGPTTIAGVLTQINIADQLNKVEEEKSLHDSIKQLTSRTNREYRPAESDLQKMVASLLEDNLILISSSFAEYAFDAAWEVIESLPNSDSRFQGRIAFEDTIGKNVEFSLQKLCEQRADGDVETVLLVDALHTQANTFPASILGNSVRVEAAKQDLRNSKLLLVVVINHQYATEKKLSQPNLSYKSFCYWNIPFLQPFFQTLFADYENLLTEITKQRAGGKWEDDELSFTQQVINYHVNDKLRDIIDNGGPKDPETFAESKLKTARPVQKTVLYTATFFNEITSPEFCRVVEALLGTRTILMDAPDISTNGATPAKTKIEVPLRRLWDEEKDEIFTELLVETSTSTDSPRTVSLAEFNLAEPLRKRFEKYHRFYLMDQFRSLQHSGIFFYPSLRLAKNTTQLAVELAQLYPDEFNEGWIVALVKCIRKHFAEGGSDEGQADDTMFRFLSNTQPGAFNVAFARVSEVCKRFLESPQQKSVVPTSLEYLMQTGYQQEVLWLIKQLKFNPDFDDWYWLKQLLNRSDSKTQYLTYHYIISYLKQMGTRVYEGLKKMGEWLPPTDRSNYSEFELFLFRVLIKYCLDTTDSFKEKHYGKWPSRYALFNFADEESANANLSLLAHWLLHPGVDRTLASLKLGTRITLIGILLAEWTFILLGQPGASQTNVNKKEEPRREAPDSWSTSQTFAVLVKQFFDRLDPRQELELLKCWTQYEHALFIFGNSHLIDDDEHKENEWKSALVQRLISELRIASATAKPMLMNSRGAVLTGTAA